MDKNHTFTVTELAVIKAFIKKRYPNAIRSIGAVAKETKLSIEVVGDVFDKYDRCLFIHCGDGYFSFNILTFTGLFGRKFLNLYVDYDPKRVLAYIQHCEQELNEPTLTLVILPCVDEDTEISAAELVATVDPAILVSGLVKDAVNALKQEGE